MFQPRFKNGRNMAALCPEIYALQVLRRTPYKFKWNISYLNEKKSADWKNKFSEHDFLKPSKPFVLDLATNCPTNLLIQSRYQLTSHLHLRLRTWAQNQSHTQIYDLPRITAVKPKRQIPVDDRLWICRLKVLKELMRKPWFKKKHYLKQQHLIFSTFCNIVLPPLLF